MAAHSASTKVGYAGNKFFSIWRPKWTAVTVNSVESIDRAKIELSIVPIVALEDHVDGVL
jgi:hypothetical protein